MNRTEKILLNEKTNFFYIKRGVERTPSGSAVEIIQCNPGIRTNEGVLKGTIAFGLRNMTGQLIAYSYDTDDLVLFAIEHDWVMDHPVYQMMKS